MEYLTFAESGVCPLEAGGEDLADVGEVEEEERDPDDGVEDGHDLADGGDGHDVSVTCRKDGCEYILEIVFRGERQRQELATVLF